jgi:hypothetical protein
VSITEVTDSTSHTTGALLYMADGVAGNLYVNSNGYFGNTDILETPTFLGI